MMKSICTVPLMGILAFTIGCSSSDDIVTMSIKGGHFQKLQTGEMDPHPNLEGYAHLVITNETSEVDVYVAGLTPNKQYNSHVHNAWCSNGDQAPGGGHYLQNPEGNDDADNGLWPMVTVDENGIGMGSAKNKFVVNDDAKSVIIHDADDSSIRIACVDLVSTHGLSGTFSATEAGADLYESIEGQAFVSISQADGGMSKAEVSVIGLTAATAEQVMSQELPMYGSHVHLNDCATEGGGAHYNYNVGDEDIETNELWPKITVDAFGYGGGWDSKAFKADLDMTKSIVIHDIADSSVRVACASLTKDLLAFRSGSFVLTSYGEDKTPDLKGRAQLSVSMAGETTASLYVTGLEVVDVEYMSHVHNQACSSDSGGGHYLQNMSGGDNALNGLFLPFTPSADSPAMAEVTKNFIVRPDARSVVIHNAEDGKKIACADLM